MAATATMAATKLGVGVATVGTVAGAGIGLAAGGLLAYSIYKINRGIDSTNTSSRAEESMDRLVEVTNKEFDKRMQELAQKGGAVKGTAKRFQDRVSAIKRQGKTFEGREAAKRKEYEAKGAERE